MKVSAVQNFQSAGYSDAVLLKIISQVCFLYTTTGSLQRQKVQGFKFRNMCKYWHKYVCKLLVQCYIDNFRMVFYIVLAYLMRKNKTLLSESCTKVFKSSSMFKVCQFNLGLY